MDSQTAHRLVAASLVVMLLYGLVSGKGKQIGSFKQVWAIGVLGLFMSLISDFIPEVGGALAILFAIAFVGGGQQRINNIITNAIRKKVTQ